MSRVGSIKSALAKEILILQPPLKYFVGRICISASNPRVRVRVRVSVKVSVSVRVRV
jgi:hypothetical protein